MKNTKDIIDVTSNKIVLYFSNTISKKFHIPFVCDEETARVLALISVLGEDNLICLNEEVVNPKELQINLELKYPPHK